jgi:HK97 family phage major capsid protein
MSEVEEVFEKANEVPGSVVVGGVHAVTDPAAGDMGTFTGGVAPGIPSVISGTAGGGVLRPEQSRRFIDYTWDHMVWAREGRRIVMNANTAELNKMGVGERVIRAASQANADYTNAEVAFTKIEFTTRKVRLDWQVSTEGLEDNIEGDALEDHIASQMTQQFAHDLEDLAISADASGSGFVTILGYDGFMEQYKAAVTEVTWTNGGAPTVETYQELIKAIPRKFRAVKSNLVFYVSSDAFTDTVNGLGSTGNLTTEQLINRVVDGSAPQVIGSPVNYRVLGLPMREVPLLNDAGGEAIVLTFPQNNIWGFQRDITVHRQFQPKSDTTEYTVYARFGIAIEEPVAAAVAIEAAS